MSINKEANEFTAVVLAGGEGTRLSPLTHGHVKALLPVGNHAMLWYSLRWLSAGGYSKPIVITTETSQDEIGAWFNKAGGSTGSDPQFISVPDDADTAQALKAVADKVLGSVIVVSCDTITNIPLSDILAYHRRKAATATILMKHKKLPDSKDKTAAKERHLTEFVGLEEDSRVTLFASSAELSDVKMKKAYLTRRPNMKLTTSLIDSHVYVFSNWVFELLKHKKTLTSLKHELLPVLAAQQFRRQKPDGSWGDLPIPPPSQPALTTSTPPPFPPVFTETDFGSKVHGSPTSVFYDPVRVYAYIADNGGKVALDPTTIKRLGDKTLPGEYLTRVNHLSTYHEANKELAKCASQGKEGSCPEWETISNELQENWMKPSKEGKFPSKVSVSAPSLIGTGYQPAEGVVVKATVVGNNVAIDTQARVSQSVVMHNVKIGSGCVIQNCIIGSGCVIPPRTTLKECVLGPNVDELKQSEHKGEFISKDDF
eukprot:TRINITY_DN5478_c0_g1_i1.p1 TRINITY_DN5478_c0_g1~~TRINITY_DN5478_c0_g1_i1.p1  ORF type:complete len:508 (+),score=68.12 TRINITY_DN5478_c0_g1_i1:74-1525(+)